MLDRLHTTAALLVLDRRHWSLGPPVHPVGGPLGAVAQVVAAVGHAGVHGADLSLALPWPQGQGRGPWHTANELCPVVY